VRHTGFLRRQASWIKPLASASSTQKQRWQYGTLAQRNRAVARDFRLYDLMEGMGTDRSVTDRCLTDEAVAKRITAQSDSAAALGIIDPPGLAINETMLEGVTTWAALRPHIDKSF
jgi:predicted DsbA family dithiol-disulfide isomerase